AAPARSVCRAAGPAPSIPFAPGKKPYSESKLRFSWKITTTCSIRSIPGVGEGAAAGLVHAAATSSVVPSAEMCRQTLFMSASFELQGLAADARQRGGARHAGKGLGGAH